MSGRIVLHLNKGLGWTAPVFVAGCGDCGTELARSTSQAVAERTARRTRCPVCGTRTARRLPGVRSGSNWAGACGPMQIGCIPHSKAGNAWARYGHGRPHDPANAIPAAARYLVDHGARHHLDGALFAYNHSWPYVARVKELARHYSRGGGRR